MRDIFLSDLHIGVDATTNLYQSKVHEPGLKAVLRYIQNGKDIRDIVILGDWVDLWMYRTTAVPQRELQADREELLPDVAQIFAANSRLFTEQTDGSGDFITCLRNISGKLYYINGNHDLTVTLDQITGFLKEYPELKEKVSYDPKRYSDGDICGEHGHYFSMVCRPYPGQSLPFGYYMTRGAADGGTKTPNINLPMLKDAVKRGYSFAESMLTFIVYQNKITRSFDAPFDFPMHFAMPDLPGRISSTEVAGYFPDSADFNLDEFEKTDVLLGIDDLGEYARKIVKEGFKLVILGHTHREEMTQDFRPVFVNKPTKAGDALYSTYVNTGFLCSEDTAKPSTFVEVCHAQGDKPRTVNIYGVPLDGSAPNLRESRRF